VKFKGGVEEAARMLMGLGPSAAKKLLEEIRAKDPEMAQKLEESMVRMEDLQYLTPSMLVGLLRDIPLDTFGLALRTVDQEIVKKLLDMVSTGIKLDIEDGLKGPPRRVSEVESAQQKVLKVVREKIDKGHIVLDPAGDTLV
jgi:flagellar motor switch protein FliG